MFFTLGLCDVIESDGYFKYSRIVYFIVENKKLIKVECKSFLNNMYQP